MESDQATSYSQLLLSRISALEGSHPRQVADTRLLAELANFDNVDFDESGLCQEFDKKVIDERVSVQDRIETVRKFFVNEVTSTLALDKDLLFEVSECKKVNAEYVVATERIVSKKKEHESVISLRNKLQELCRLIQQQTKDVIANSSELDAEEKKTAASLDTQFTSSIEHITSQLVSQEKSLADQDAENLELKNKLSQFEEHIALRSQHYAAQLKAKELEVQLEEAKLAQQQHLNEQSSNKLESKSAKLLAVQASNEEIVSQLALYAEKFDMFEEALTRSNSMFEQFEHKIAELDANIENVSREKSLRKEICCKLDLNLFDLIDSKASPGQEVERAQANRDALQQECRRLQQTRSDLLKQKK